MLVLLLVFLIPFCSYYCSLRVIIAIIRIIFHCIFFIPSRCLLEQLLLLDNEIDFEEFGVNSLFFLNKLGTLWAPKIHQSTLALTVHLLCCIVYSFILWLFLVLLFLVVFFVLSSGDMWCFLGKCFWVTRYIALIFVGDGTCKLSLFNFLSLLFHASHRK